MRCLRDDAAQGAGLRGEREWFADGDPAQPKRPLVEAGLQPPLVVHFAGPIRMSRKPPGSTPHEAGPEASSGIASSGPGAWWAAYEPARVAGDTTVGRIGSLRTGVAPTGREGSNKPVT